MDTDKLLELASALDKDAFASSLPNAFLVVTLAPDAAPIEFETVVAAQAQKRPMPERSQPLAAAGMSIFEMVKAPGHPYPDRISVGRARNCDIVLRDASISKLHAHFRRAPDRSYLLVDCASQNGTRLNGEPLVPNQPAPVSVGSRLVFGRIQARLLGAAELYDVLRALGKVSQRVAGSKGSSS